jgi:hypothetical protein
MAPYAVIAGLLMRLDKPVEWALFALPIFLPWPVLALLFQWTPILSEPWSEAKTRWLFWPLLYFACLGCWHLAWNSRWTTLVSMEGTFRADLRWGDPLVFGTAFCLQAAVIFLLGRRSGKGGEVHSPGIGSGKRD